MAPDDQAAVVADSPPEAPAPPSGTTAAPAQPLLPRLADRVCGLIGLQRIQGFSLGGTFSEAFQRRSLDELEAHLIVGTARTTPPLGEVSHAWPRPWLFLRSLGMSLLVYGAFVLGWKEFQNPYLIPGLLIVGSFVIPLALLLFFFEMNVLRNVSLYQVGRLVFLGGVVSLLASLLGFHVTELDAWLGAASAGIVEESGKLAALLLVAGRARYPWTLNGLLLGAAVGTGFAVFESAGYAFVAGVSVGDRAMLDLIELRGALSVLGGHVLWTGLVGAALWRVKGERRFRPGMLLDGRFVRVFALAAGLHMVWNSPLVLPLYLKYVVLGFVAWVAILAFVQEGLGEVARAKEAGR